jgi:putative ABC transport system permease protein
MNFPIGTKASYLANDTTDYLNASAFRIAYIPGLIKNINIISYMMTIFILLLSCLITAIIISRYIESNRKTIGIMRANGIRKKDICFSLLPFALIPTVIGGIVGYIFGLVMQIPMLGMFGSY